MPADDKFEALVPHAIADLIPTYLDNRRKELEALHTALKARDFQQLRYFGHRMKGVGESYGFTHISALGTRIEERARESDTSNLQSLIGQYADYLTNVRITYVGEEE